jgi:hypothetical protein
VAHELGLAFGLLGHPWIYHSDRGMEVHSKEVIGMVKVFHPSCTTIMGMPRTPRHQGSVERANQEIKKICSEHRGDRGSKWYPQRRRKLD